MSTDRQHPHPGPARHVARMTAFALATVLSAATGCGPVTSPPVVAAPSAATPVGSAARTTAAQQPHDLAEDLAHQETARTQPPALLAHHLLLDRGRRTVAPYRKALP